jgi:HEAT repeat protein
MRILALIGLMFLASGCTRTGPTQAGGKPIDHWLNALNAPDPNMRKTAATKLGNVGPADPAVFPALHAALKDHDAGVRREVILALVKIGPAAKEAAPALADLYQRDPDAKVREFASKALAKLQ